MDSDVASTVAIIFGILFLLGGIFILVVGIIYFTVGVGDYSPEQNFSAGVMMTVCATPLLIIGITLILYAHLKKKKYEILLEYANFLRAYRRIKISEFARKIGKTEFEAEKIIVKLLENKLINGYIDRRTQEFVTYEAIYQERVENIKCPNCGATVSGVFLVGEVVMCPYCKTVFKVER